jgi:hypothetical protein
MPKSQKKTLEEKNEVVEADIVHSTRMILIGDRE